MVLEAGIKSNATEVGVYALAFMSGYNVDKFLEKIEAISEAVWGIKKSRVGSIKEKDDC